MVDFITVGAVIATTAATGLCVANILRKKDNLVKLVGTSASMVTIIFAQTVLYPKLRDHTFTVQTVLGVGIISISTWTYNYYKQLDPANEQGSYSSVSLGEPGEQEEGDKMTTKSTVKDNTFTPTPKKLLGCILLVLCLTAWTANYGPNPIFTSDQVSQPPPSPAQPSDDASFSETVKEPVPESIPEPALTHSAVPTLSAVPIQPAVPTQPALPAVVDDVKRFFAPRNITPAEWGHTDTPLSCIENWVDKYADPTSANFTHWETSFLQSGCPVYPIPQGGMIFHQFWTGPWRPFNEISIEAWLATQRLGDGHRLIYWYNDGGPTPDVRRRFTEGEYGKYVEFREFDAIAEAKGYCVEDMPEWNNEKYIEDNDMNVSSLSDIVRNLLLAKYGGVWLDSDTIPVRDLTPMIRSGPSAGAVSVLLALFETES
jgi:Capsular polysaccharide synthesis protein